MIPSRSRLLALAALWLAGAAAAPFALAQSGAYPTKPIRWVVPYPAGSPVDVSARRIGDAMSARLGQPIVIENKPGAYGTIGAGDVARAAPDGYTLMYTIQDPVIAATATVKSLPYDPARDFKYLTMLTLSGAVVVINAKYGVSSVRELVELAKKSDPPLAYGSWGPGSLPAVIIETFARQAGVTFRDIHYRGSPPAMQDTLGGQIAFTLSAPPIAAPLIAAGKMKAVAVVGTRRSPALPDTETFVEAGYDNFVMRNLVWSALIGPAGLPPAIVARTVETAQSVLREPAIVKFLTDGGYEIVGSSPAEFERVFRAESAVIPKVIREDLKVVAQ
jgi:tripartite-type tricarboxylate transporter receptor subunit TctC